MFDAQAFAYWLHGWSEINGGTPPSATQWQVINDHLDLVFNKVTPNRSVVVTTITGQVPISPSISMPSGSLVDFSWYPKSLREWNRLHPDNPRFC